MVFDLINSEQETKCASRTRHVDGTSPVTSSSMLGKASVFVWNWNDIAPTHHHLSTPSAPLQTMCEEAARAQARQ